MRSAFACRKRWNAAQGGSRDEGGNVALRLNGYYQPHDFDAALDRAAGTAPHHRRRAPANPTLNAQLFFKAPPYDLRRGAVAKPLAVLFETPYATNCTQ